MTNKISTRQVAVSLLKNIEQGRANLGDMMPVSVYRTMEYTLMETLTSKFGQDVCVEVFKEAGKLAGKIFYENHLSQCESVEDLLAQWQKVFIELKMGILRIEKLDLEGTTVATLSEDLDCSGLPVIGDTICFYDEGFIEGILNTYSQKVYVAEEVDCWAKGDRVCRFEIKLGE